jgi:hypothetical protein
MARNRWGLHVVRDACSGECPCLRSTTFKGLGCFFVLACGSCRMPIRPVAQAWVSPDTHVSRLTCTRRKHASKSYSAWHAIGGACTWCVTHARVHALACGPPLSKGWGASSCLHAALAACPFGPFRRLGLSPDTHVSRLTCTPRKHASKSYSAWQQSVGLARGA